MTRKYTIEDIEKPRDKLVFITLLHLKRIPLINLVKWLVPIIRADNALESISWLRTCEVITTQGKFVQAAQAMIALQAQEKLRIPSKLILPALKKSMKGVKLNPINLGIRAYRILNHLRNEGIGSILTLHAVIYTGNQELKKWVKTIPLPGAIFTYFIMMKAVEPKPKMVVTRSWLSKAFSDTLTGNLTHQWTSETL